LTKTETEFQNIGVSDRFRRRRSPPSPPLWADDACKDGDMDVILDREKCTGLGICESVAPDHFEIDDDGELVVLRAEVRDGERALLEEAVRACPTGALRLSTEPAAEPA
jgi:ferredoxin